ncbi:MAG: lactate racemase domain-containing protein [Candidatus Brocadiaceae bacterium]|jgi:nickel-dependent lactate racemase
MPTIFAEGGADRVITPELKRRALRAAIEYAGDLSKVLVLPPDATRIHSDAGTLTRMLHEELRGSGTFHAMPAIGTHFPMDADQIRRMFGEGIPLEAFKEHRWREDLIRLGEVPSSFVHQVSEDALREAMPDYSVPVELNGRLVEGGYTAIFSIGQVLPHEVVGMANGFKNVLVGTGGQETINKTHFLGAAYGMERMMGRAETPVRAVLNYAHDRYLSDLGEVYILTVMAPDASGEMVMRGIYVGTGHATFLRAAELSQRVNITLLEAPPSDVVAYLDPEEYHSTWLGNKAIYRTRMAIADGGTLTVIAPGVRTFGEDPEIDRLIRRHGYRGTPATLKAVERDAELRDNLSAAAHLIHGSSEGRFRIIYATDPSLLSREEAEGVGFEWRDVTAATHQYEPEQLSDGPREGFYFIRRPGQGLWAVADAFTD